MGITPVFPSVCQRPPIRYGLPTAMQGKVKTSRLSRRSRGATYAIAYRQCTSGCYCLVKVTEILVRPGFVACVSSVVDIPAYLCPLP